MPGLVFLGLTVAVLSSLGAPLIPDLSKLYHVSLGTAQWALTIAFLVSAVATPVMGRIGDGPRRRELILAALVVVCVGGVLAALPLGFPVLLAGRALQGVGLGLTPLAIATARDALPAGRAESAVASLSITTVAGVGLGYPLTGLIVQLAGVHAAFWFGAAISAVALVVAYLIVPPATSQARTPLDVVGALLLAGTLAALLLAISEGSEWGWASVSVLGLFAAAVIVGAVWVRWEQHSAHPLVRLDQLRQRPVLTADATAVAAGVGMYFLISIVTRYVQAPRSVGHGLGATVFVSGLILVPFSVASLLAQPAASWLLRHMRPARVLPAGCVPMVASLLLLAFARDGLVQQCIVMALAGLGVGCIFAVMPRMIVDAVPPEETGSAISFNQVLRLVGYATGSALSAVILQVATPVRHLLPTSHAYTIAALLGGLLWVATAAIAFALPGHRPEQQASPH